MNNQERVIDHNLEGYILEIVCECENGEFFDMEDGYHICIKNP